MGVSSMTPWGKGLAAVWSLVCANFWCTHSDFCKQWQKSYNFTISWFVFAVISELLIGFHEWICTFYDKAKTVIKNPWYCMIWDFSLLEGIVAWKIIHLKWYGLLHRFFFFFHICEFVLELLFFMCMDFNSIQSVWKKTLNSCLD